MITLRPTETIYTALLTKVFRAVFHFGRTYAFSFSGISEIVPLDDALSFGTAIVTESALSARMH